MKIGGRSKKIVGRQTAYLVDKLMKDLSKFNYAT
jgi:hypothetical protein